MIVVRLTLTLPAYAPTDTVVAPPPPFPFNPGRRVEPSWKFANYIYLYLIIILCRWVFTFA